MISLPTDLSYFHEHVIAMLEQLCRDPRMVDIEARITEGDLHRIARAYQLVTQKKDPWEMATKGEREKWCERFEKASVEMMLLLEQGPQVYVTYGIKRESSISMSAKGAFEVLVDEMRDHMEIMRPPLLKKPRDPKAQRAEFIVRIKRHLKWAKPKTVLTMTDVATITSIIFDDDAVTPSLVSRLWR